MQKLFFLRVYHKIIRFIIFISPENTCNSIFLIFGINLLHSFIDIILENLGITARSFWARAPVIFWHTLKKIKNTTILLRKLLITVLHVPNILGIIKKNIWPPGGWSWRLTRYRYKGHTSIFLHICLNVGFLWLWFQFSHRKWYLTT